MELFKQFLLAARVHLRQPPMTYVTMMENSMNA